MANTLVYYYTATITAVKSFIVQAPRVSSQFGASLLEAVFTIINFLNGYSTVHWKTPVKPNVYKTITKVVQICFDFKNNSYPGMR